MKNQLPVATVMNERSTSRGSNQAKLANYYMWLGIFGGIAAGIGLIAAAEILFRFPIHF